MPDEDFRGGFAENLDGVHLMNGEFTLCGDSFDIAETEDDFTAGSIRSTTKRTVTCRRCAEIIYLCRGVRVGQIVEGQPFDV